MRTQHNNHQSAALAAHPNASRITTKAAMANFTGAIALTVTALAMTFVALDASAEITQDCILEGTVDKRKAEELGQPVYVKFRNARRGSEASCTMNRRSKSRRVQFISSPDVSPVEDAAHGAKVRYRYIEHDNQPGSWELIDISEG